MIYLFAVIIIVLMERGSGIEIYRIEKLDIVLVSDQTNAISLRFNRSVIRFRSNPYDLMRF